MPRAAAGYVKFLPDRGNTLWPANQETPCRDDRAGTTQHGANSKVALAAIKGGGMLAQLAEHWMSTSPSHVVEGAARTRCCRCFRFRRHGAAPAAGDLKSLYVELRGLTLENVFWKGRSAYPLIRGDVSASRHASASCGLLPVRRKHPNNIWLCSHLSGALRSSMLCRTKQESADIFSQR